MAWLVVGYILACVIVDCALLSYLQHRLFQEPQGLMDAIRENFVPNWLSVLFDESREHWWLRFKLGLLILALFCLIFIEIKTFDLLFSR